MDDSKLKILNGVNLMVPLKKVLHANPHWSAAHLKAAAAAYRHFLYVSLIYKGKFRVVPHLSVDEVWHQHILCTKNYMEFCNAFFGDYFHHDPGEGGAPTTNDQDGYGMTCNAIVHHFDAKDDPRVLLAPFYPTETPSAIMARNGTV
jgi:hypothetical protein